MRINLCRRPDAAADTLLARGPVQAYVGHATHLTGTPMALAVVL